MYIYWPSKQHKLGPWALPQMANGQVTLILETSFVIEKRINHKWTLVSYSPYQDPKSLKY